MPAQLYNVIYSCTPTQYATALAALVTGGGTVIQAPIQAQGILKLASGEQVDFSFDGAYYLRFFGANNAPVSAQANAGITQTELSATMLAFLTTNVNPTCGAPVNSAAANVPGPAA